jgi:hypothetical protein
MAEQERTNSLFVVPPHHMRIGILEYDGKEHSDVSLYDTSSISAC